MTFKKLIGFLHLWLGLSSGLVVFIISLTGCIYAFKVEIENITQPYRFVQSENKPFLAPSVLRKSAEKELPDKHVHSVQYEGKGNAAQISFYNETPFYYYTAFLNPYNGKVLHVKDMKSDFFGFILDGHFYLWLPNEIGQVVVASSTLIFVVMLISGIILWWPKNKNAVKQRFWFRWKENIKWKRKNYDLHNIMGFYACWIAVFLALTGLVWGFEWFSNSVYWVAAGGEPRIPYQEVYSDTTVQSRLSVAPVDMVFRKLSVEAPQAEAIEIHFPEENKSVIAASTNDDAGTYWRNDYRNFDQYTLKEIDVKHSWGRIQNASVADKVVRMNYDIHVGAIFGLAGKCLAFLASLVCASLPVTGFCIWLGRKKKKKKLLISSPENQKRNKIMQ